MRRVLVVLAVLFAVGAAADAQSTPAYNQLYAVAANPTLRASDGNLYGTDYDGFFSVSPTAYTYTVLNPNYRNVNTTLCLEAADGTLLGITGSEFVKLTLSGSATVLAAANRNDCPIPGSDGNYYGTTYGEGAYGYGSIYELTPAGVLTTLYSFTGTGDGEYPSNLVQGSDSGFYGISSAGLFRYTVANGLSINPLTISGGTGEVLIEGPDSNFYLSTALNLYKITPTGAVSVLAPPPSIYGESDGTIAQTFLGGDQRFYMNQSVTNSGTCDPYDASVSVVPVDLSGNIYPSYFNLYGTGNYSDISTSATMFLGGDGNFYGGVSASYLNGGVDCEDPTETNSNAIFSEVSPNPPTPPVAMNLSADHILPGKDVTLTWSVNNAFSQTLQQCYGYGALSGKVPLTGSVTAKGVPAGSYTASIVCGGTETGFVRLVVGSTQITAGSGVPSVYVGQPVGLYANIANDGNPVPTGTVQFLYGTAVVGSATLGAGIASFVLPTANVPPGTYTLTAKYLGDGNYSPVASAPFSLTVLPKIATTVALTPATQTLVQGQTATFTATTGSSASGSYPDGTVNLLFGANVIATATQSSGYTASVTFSPVTSGFPAGTYSLTAQYLGSAIYQASTSSPVTVKIVNGDSITVAANPNPVPAGQSFKLTATLMGSPLPTGTVVFYAGSRDIGSTTVNGSGVATVTVAAGTLTSGSYQVTGYYAGDSNNVAITSSPVTLTVD